MLTVVLASEKVLKEFKNWYSFFKEYKEFELLCYCVDLATIKFCEKNKIKYVDISKKHTLHDNNFWLTKAYIFKEVSKEYSFIYSDLDALWIRNPIEIFKSNPDSDILFSQGTYFPKHVNDELGFVFCAGFFYVNKIANSQIFFEKVYEAALNGIKDDQYNINDLLIKDLKILNSENFLEVSYNNEKFNIYRGYVNLYNNFYKLKITLIPHWKVVRKSELKTTNSIIIHPVEKNIYGNAFYFFYKNNLLHKNFDFFYKSKQIFKTKLRHLNKK